MSVDSARVVPFSVTLTIFKLLCCFGWAGLGRAWVMVRVVDKMRDVSGGGRRDERWRQKGEFK